MYSSSKPKPERFSEQEVSPDSILYLRKSIGRAVGLFNLLPNSLRGVFEARYYEENDEDFLPEAIRLELDAFTNSYGGGGEGDSYRENMGRGLEVPYRTSVLHVGLFHEKQLAGFFSVFLTRRYLFPESKLASMAYGLDSLDHLVITKLAKTADHRINREMVLAHNPLILLLGMSLQQLSLNSPLTIEAIVQSKTIQLIHRRATMFFPSYALPLNLGYKSDVEGRSHLDMSLMLMYIGKTTFRDFLSALFFNSTRKVHEKK